MKCGKGDPLSLSGYTVTLKWAQWRGKIMGKSPNNAGLMKELSDQAETLYVLLYLFLLQY